MLVKERKGKRKNFVYLNFFVWKNFLKDCFKKKTFEEKIPTKKKQFLLRIYMGDHNTS